MELAVLVIHDDPGSTPRDITGYIALGSGFEDSGNYLGMTKDPVGLLSVLQKALGSGWELAGQLPRADGATLLFLQRSSDGVTLDLTVQDPGTVCTGFLPAWDDDPATMVRDDE
jgi:hypothetical protein